MLILDNVVAANRKRLEREQLQIQIKRAKFDRDAAILNIIEQAAIAEFKLPAQGGFAGIAAGIAIGVEAAAQIALLLAKPLPQMPAYAKGTSNHPGGPALVGEGQYQELVSEPVGNSFIADRPMVLSNLAKGSKVFPLSTEMVIQGMQNDMLIAMAGQVEASERQIAQQNNNKVLTEIKDAVYESGRLTAQAMRKQKAANVVVTVHADWYSHIKKNVTD